MHGDGEPALRKAWGPLTLTLFGIGSTIGAGIFVLTGTAAAQFAGPALALSFLVAAAGCLCAAFCYAELAAMMPAAGSAYTYATVALGPIVGWFVGWNLVLEYLVNSSTIAVGWSAYFVAFLGAHGIHLSPAWTSAPLAAEGYGLVLTGSFLNLPAALVTFALGVPLLFGIRGSGVLNDALVYVKVGVVVLVILFGIAFVDSGNWHPFIPANSSGIFGEFGVGGVLRGAAVIFFAYIGFDAVSTAAQESVNPQRDMPIGLLASLAICTLLYVAMSLVLTGIVPYRELNVANPVFVAIQRAGPGLYWLREVVNIGALVGLASAILAGLLGQSRICYSMARDGFLPALFGRVHARFRTPFAGTLVVSLVAAAIAGVFPIELLGELVSIGTLLAFSIVCGAVLVLRRIDPHRERPYRAPWSPVLPILGIVSCVGLMFALPGGTWIRLLVWTLLGFALLALRWRKLRPHQPFVRSHTATTSSPGPSTT